VGHRVVTSVLIVDRGSGAVSGLEIHEAVRGADSRLPTVIFNTSHGDVFSTMLATSTSLLEGAIAAATTTAETLATNVP